MGLVTAASWTRGCECRWGLEYEDDVVEDAMKLRADWDTQDGNGPTLLGFHVSSKSDLHYWPFSMRRFAHLSPSYGGKLQHRAHDLSPWIGP